MDNVSQFRQAECPQCKSRFSFRRTRPPHFDDEGFESYEFHCDHCGTSLVGVIDPYDGKLLLSIRALAV